MADYKELLRRAISALPENNGAARRAVYEKARSALVNQLRAIQPPLPARDITQHRLQLEDCIRQVEQEASEAVISLGREGALSRPATIPRATPSPAPIPPRDDPRAEFAPVVAPVPRPQINPRSEAPQPAAPIEPIVAHEPENEPAPQPVITPAPAMPLAPPPASTSIEDIIAQAAASSGAAVSREETDDDTLAARVFSSVPAAASQPGVIEAPRPSFFTPRRDPAPADALPVVGATTPIISPVPTRAEPALGSTALASQPATTPVIIEPPLPEQKALSSVREVELEQTGTREAEGAIERAIETLDREARGEQVAPLPDRSPLDAAQSGEDASDDAGFTPPTGGRRSGAGLTIFLIVFALLLVGVGGAGFWAWREGYIDIDQMFGRTQTASTQPAATTGSDMPTMGTTTTDPAQNETGNAGPGNTATTAATEPTSELAGVEEDRLEPMPQSVTPSGTETVLPSLNGEAKTEERLSGADTSIAATNDPTASVDPAVLAGNQSLLLEASADGQSGAVPFSGTVDWTEGVDEIGQPTIVGKASIPARNLGVTITIRKNSDPALPASHLMEISFDVPDTFVGGSIATLAGVLLKNEELVPGTALSGAAARVVGNSFLFALSASASDLSGNMDLLKSRRWMDLALVYGTGRNAILTLEKDDDTQALFAKVLAAWGE